MSTRIKTDDDEPAESLVARILAGVARRMAESHERVQAAIEAANARREELAEARYQHDKDNP